MKEHCVSVHCTSRWLSIGIFVMDMCTSRWLSIGIFVMEMPPSRDFAGGREEEEITLAGLVGLVKGMDDSIRFLQRIIFPLPTSQSGVVKHS